MKKLVVATVLAGALMVGACGGGEDETACGVTLAGNKLCGEDARTYCEMIDGYDKDSASYDTCKVMLRDQYTDEQNAALDEVNACETAKCVSDFIDGK